MTITTAFLYGKRVAIGLKIAVCCLSLSLTIACTGMSPIAPSVAAAPIPVVPEQTILVPPVALDAPPPAPALPAFPVPEPVPEPYIDPFHPSLNDYRWSPVGVTITNRSPRRLLYLLAIYATPYPAGHPQYYTGQVLLSLSEGYADGKGGELTLTGTRPDCGTYQMDVYPNATAADVKSGRIAIHPGNPQGVSELSHSNGTTGACAPIAPPILCEDSHPAKAAFLGWVDMTASLIGSVQLANDGQWEVRLLAAGTLAQYQANTPDFVKDTASVSLTCGQASVLQSVKFAWNGDPSKYWWVDVRRNGSLVLQSPVLTKPLD